MPHQLPTAACLRLPEDGGSKKNNLGSPLRLSTFSSHTAGSSTKSSWNDLLSLERNFSILFSSPMSPGCEGSRQGSSDLESHFGKGGVVHLHLVVWFPLFPEERMPVASLTGHARSGFPPHSEVVGITGARPVSPQARASVARDRGCWKSLRGCVARFPPKSHP